MSELKLNDFCKEVGGKCEQLGVDSSDEIEFSFGDDEE
jgi:hypothetical protein